MPNNQTPPLDPQLLALLRNDVKIMSRLKALETIVANAVPSDEREPWHKLLDEQYNRCLQDLLEEYEKKSPALAALLDTRGPDDLSGFEW